MFSIPVLAHLYNVIWSAFSYESKISRVKYFAQRLPGFEVRIASTSAKSLSTASLYCSSVKFSVLTPDPIVFFTLSFASDAWITFVFLVDGNTVLFLRVCVCEGMRFADRSTSAKGLRSIVRLGW